jgi:hypothetical protein
VNNGSGAPGQQRQAADVLADRIAATLVNHEPGWRMPRPSALARRHNVSVGEVRAAVDQLVARQVVRRSADGQLYRSSPAEYLIPLEGTARLGTRVDPMSGNLTCLSYNVSWRPAPDDAASALRIGPGDPDCLPHIAAVQMQPPPKSVARKLRLTAGQMAVLVTVLFGQGARQRPAALTAAVLRPDMFRIAMEAAPPGVASPNLASASRLGNDW